MIPLEGDQNQFPPAVLVPKTVKLISNNPVFHGYAKTPLLQQLCCVVLWSTASLFIFELLLLALDFLSYLSKNTIFPVSLFLDFILVETLFLDLWIIIVEWCIHFFFPPEKKLLFRWHGRCNWCLSAICPFSCVGSLRPFCLRGRHKVGSNGEI